MATNPSPSPPSLDFDSLLATLSTHLQTYKANFLTQASLAFSRLTPRGILRLVIMVGAYCLLRPYLIKLGGKFQAQDHERAVDMEEVEKLRKAEGLSGSGGLKGKLEIPEDTESEGEDGGDAATVTATAGATTAATGTGADWGKKARRRQRRVMRQLLEADERRRREEEEAASDKEIEDLLIG